MWSQLSSSLGPFCFAPLITSWALFPDGSAIGIISWSIGNVSLFWKRSTTTPEDRVAGTSWYWKFCTKIVAFGVMAPPDGELSEEQAVAATATTAATTGSLHPRNERVMSPSWCVPTHQRCLRER